MKVVLKQIFELKHHLGVNANAMLQERIAKELFQI